MRRIRSRCCARAASGHATAVPPINVMNSRRLTVAPGVKSTASCHNGQGLETGESDVNCDQLFGL